MAMSSPLCFLDTETTGVHPGRQVWEIAMIRRDDEGQSETSMFVDVDLSAADPFGLAVGRFYDRHPVGRYYSGGVPFATTPASRTGEMVTRQQAAELVARWTHGAHIVGAVPNFDTATLDPLLRSHGLIPAWHYHLIDVEALAVGYLWSSLAVRAADFVKTGLPWKSDDLNAALGLEPVPEDERHTALGDARWAMRIYDTVTGVVS